jgi:cell wall-associated NlpC family hydrolase
MRFYTAVILMALLAGCAGQHDTDDQLPDADQANAVVFTAMNQVGIPYRYGGSSPRSGFDCSGLIAYVYRESAGMTLPRTVIGINDMSAPGIDHINDLYSGDLILFNSGKGGRPDHAGIYVGKGRFVHAPSRGGKVRLESVDQGYWKAHFIKAKRPLVRSTRR